ncbi:MAG: hypothetical protein GXP28_07950 [Planctomycetes bacterium]|nr:hypothetical protein [Planctomycetota bacterium]
MSWKSVGEAAAAPPALYRIVLLPVETLLLLACAWAVILLSVASTHNVQVRYLITPTNLRD